MLLNLVKYYEIAFKGAIVFDKEALL